MDIMGCVQPPFLNAPPMPQPDEILLCRALNASLNAVAQLSQLQQNLIKNKIQIKNTGRIIFFTSSQLRKFDLIQEFITKAIEDINKIIDQNARHE